MSNNKRALDAPPTFQAAPQAKRRRRPLQALPIVPSTAATSVEDQRRSGRGLESMGSNHDVKLLQQQHQKAMSIMQSRVAALTTRHRAEIEALVKKIKKQELEIQTEKGKILQNSGRIHELVAENEALRSEQRVSMSTSGMGHDSNDKSRVGASDLESKVEQLQYQLHKSVGELKMARQDAQLLRGQVDHAQRRLSEQGDARKLYEDTAAKLARAEFEGKQIQSRLAKSDENEKLLRQYRGEVAKMDELKRANLVMRQEIRNLRAERDNVAKLEQQVSDYKSKEYEYEEAIRDKERAKQDAIYLRQQTTEWQSAVKRFFPNVRSPHEAAEAIGTLNKKHLATLQEQTDSQLKEKAASSALLEANAELSTLKDKARGAKERCELLEKRLREHSLVEGELRRERDSLKEMLNHYDLEDATNGNIGGGGGGSHDKQRAKRIASLEKKLKALDSKNRSLEQQRRRYEEREIEHRNLQSQLKNLRNLLQKTERENNVLHSKLGRGDYDKSTTKVLHMRFNPQRKAMMQKEQKQSQVLLEKIKELELKISSYEQAMVLASSSSPSSSSSSIADNIIGGHSVAEVRQKAANFEREHRETIRREREAVASAQRWKELAEKQKSKAEEGSKRLSRLKEVFRSKVSEFREACYRMTGYKIELIDGDKYRLRPMYAGSDRDFVLIHFHHGQLSVLETDFVRELDKKVSAFLTRFHSVPAFLSQITLDLFSQTTLAPVS